MIYFPFVGDSFGGSHWSTIILARELQASGQKVKFVLHSKHNDLQYALSLNDLAYEHLPINKLAGSSPNVFKILYHVTITSFVIVRFIKSRHIRLNVIHSNDLRCNLSWMIPSFITKNIFIWHQRTFLSPSLLWVFTIPFVSHYIAISHVVYESFPKFLRKKTKIAPNPFIFKSLPSQEKIERYACLAKKERVKAVCLSRFVWWKNLDFLIIAISEFRRNYSAIAKNVQFEIYGDGDPEVKEQLIRLIDELDLEGFVSLREFTLDPGLILSKSDLLLATSVREPFGRTLIEAMSVGTLVIATEGFGHSEIINNCTNGFLVASDSPVYLSDALNQILMADNRLIVSNAYNEARNKFESKSAVTVVRQVYCDAGYETGALNV